MENYLNNILVSLGKQIGLGENVKIANIQINQIKDGHIGKTGAWETDRYAQRVFFPGCGGDCPAREVIIESCLSGGELGSILVVSCLDVLTGWLREAAQEESPKDTTGEQFRFISVDGVKLEPDDAVRQIREKSKTVLKRQLESWIGIDFRAIDELALQPYEGAKPGGGIAVAFSEDARNICDWFVEKEIPFDLQHVQLIRKLLAGTGKSGSIVLYIDKPSKPAHVVGVCHDLAKIDKNAAELLPLRIQIQGWMSWSLYIYGKMAFQRRASGYYVDRGIDLRAELEAEFGPSGSHAKLEKVICEIQAQEHGASAVILDFERKTDGTQKSAAARIQTLEAHDKALKVTFAEQPGEGAIACAAGMDGAVILDLQGNIRYLAAILDGESCIQGKLSRGSRFNSIRNFVADIAKNKNESIMGIVCSEDGEINIISGRKMREPS